MREIRCKIEWRADDERTSPGRLRGVLMAYGSPANDRPERFADGALSWEERGVILNVQHDRTQPIVRFVPSVEIGPPSTVRVDVALPDTSRGRDTATLVRNGTLTGLSVEFQALEEGERGGVREIRKAKLLAAGLVDDPSYKESAVEVRGRGAGRRRYWL